MYFRRVLKKGKMNHLFPTHPVREAAVKTTLDEEITLFTTEELLTAANGLQNRKAPGPDGIPAEALKRVACTHPETLLRNSLQPEPPKDPS